MAANYAKQLEDYFKSVPKEELDKEFKELEERNNVGPSVKEFLELIEKKYGK